MHAKMNKKAVNVNAAEEGKDAHGRVGGEGHFAKMAPFDRANNILVLPQPTVRPRRPARISARRDKALNRVASEKERTASLVTHRGPAAFWAFCAPLRTVERTPRFLCIFYNTVEIVHNDNSLKTIGFGRSRIFGRIDIVNIFRLGRRSHKTE